MNSNLNKIFWGIVIANFDLNINGINILPDFLGWILIAYGLSNFRYEDVKFDNNYINYAKLTSIIMILFSLVFELGSYTGYFLEGTLIYQTIDLFTSLIATIGFGLYFIGATEIVGLYSDTDQQILNNKTRNYLFVSFGILIIICILISLNINGLVDFSILAFISVVLFIIQFIMLLSTGNFIRKREYLKAE